MEVFDPCGTRCGKGPFHWPYGPPALQNGVRFRVKGAFFGDAPGAFGGISGVVCLCRGEFDPCCLRKESGPVLEMKCKACGAELVVFSGSGRDFCGRCVIAGTLREGPVPLPGEEGEFSLLESAHLFPEFEVLGRVGRGGMGSVYRARQRSLDRDVAIKILNARLVESPEFEERFEREAKAMALLNHPNIVGVYDYGRRGKIRYLTMEYVDGCDLRTLFRADAIDESLAFSIIAQLCEALSFAHGKGVIHRDVKPANILVDREGTAKVADFGLARIAATAEHLSLTLTGVGMGTPVYMAPEQLSDSKAIDSRADIFSSGVAIYEMLTGSLPTGKLAPPTSRLRRRNRRLDNAILQAMEPDPEARIADIRMLTDVLPVGREGASMRPQISSLRFRGAIWGLAGLLTISGVFWSLRERTRPGESAPAIVPESVPELAGSAPLEALLPEAAFPYDPAFDAMRRRGGVLKHWSLSGEFMVPGTAAEVDDFVSLDRLKYQAYGWFALRSGGGNRSNFPELDGIYGITHSTRFFHLRWDQECIPRPAGLRPGGVQAYPERALDLAQTNDFCVLVTSEKKAVFVVTAQWQPLVSRLEKQLENVSDVISVEFWGFTFALLRESGEVLAWHLHEGVFPAPEKGGPFQQIAAGEAHVVGLGRDGKLYAWSGAPFVALEHVQRSLRVPENEEKFVRVRSVARINTAQRADGTWIAWGDDDTGLIRKINSLGPALDLGIFAPGRDVEARLAWIEPAARPRP